MSDANEDVRTTIARRLEETAPVASRYREQANANEQYASGIQTSRIIRTGGGERLIEMDAWPADLPRMWQNVCGPLLGSWCALLCGDLPTASARAASVPAPIACALDCASWAIRWPSLLKLVAESNVQGTPAKFPFKACRYSAPRHGFVSSASLMIWALL